MEKAREESDEMSSAAACQGKKMLLVTVTVGRDGVLTALSAGEMFSSPA